MHYATLYQVKQYIGTTQAGDDSRLIRFINEAVRAIDERQRRRYDVRLETVYFDYPEKDLGVMGRYGADQFREMNFLRMPDDLLEAVTLTNGDGSVIAGSAYVLEPYNRYPKFKLQLLGSAGVSFNTPSSGEKKRCISLLAYWGFHTRYAEAFEDSLDTVQNNPLSAAATNMTVTDADGVALDGSVQRFQAGQILKIENELAYVAAVNNTTNAVTIKRGYNGTTAAIHAQNTPISIYRPMDNIVAACTRVVAWRYRQKDADVFDKTAILGTGVKIIPSSLPPDVVELLGPPRPASFGATL